VLSEVTKGLYTFFKKFRSATEVIRWAEPICELLTFIYDKDYDEVTEDLYKAIREAQDIDDEEEEEGF